jgi:ubiquinone/menaquinone biosynthesis C-methylase UbiE
MGAVWRFPETEAYDISETRIEHARKTAESEGYNHVIDYEVADIHKLQLREDNYDFIIAEHSLHHFDRLDQLLHKLSLSLRLEGYLVIDEFLGPSRFQWTYHQYKAASFLLSVLPKKYKTYSSGTMKSKIERPSRLRMLLKDPSEAVESSRIISLLRELFDVLEVREYGGTILHLLFSGISHNFLSADDECQRILRLCFEIEDMMIDSSNISSDFAVIICKKQAS